MTTKRPGLMAGGALALWLASACSSTKPIYLPNGEATVVGGKQPKGQAYMKIPPENPAGSVRMLSTGLVRLNPVAGGEKIRALHVELVVANQGTAYPWTFDPQRQAVSYLGQAERYPPVFVQSESPGPVNPVIAKGEVKHFHLYFRLPRKLEQADEVPQFELHWQVRTGTEAVARETLFTRLYLPGEEPSISPPYWYPYGYPFGSPYMPWGPYPPYPSTYGGIGVGFGWTAGPPLLAVPTAPINVGH